MTLSIEQLNKLVAKKEFNELKSDVRELKHEVGEFKNDVMGALDNVVKKLDTIEHAFVSNLAAHDRF